MAYDHRKIGPSYVTREAAKEDAQKAQTPKTPENYNHLHIPSVSDQHVIRGRIMNSADYD